MAFKKRSEAELLLLTETQRVQYEKELAIYEKRAAFVAQLTRYENVQIAPIPPTRKPIAVLDPVTVKAYRKQAYQAQLPAPSRMPKQHGIAFSVVRPEKLALPAVSVQLAEVRPMKIEKDQPVLPTVAKPAVHRLQYKKPEGVRPDMPVIAKPETAFVTFTKPAQPTASLPQVAMPDAGVPVGGIRITRKQAPDGMPEIAPAAAPAMAFTAPEQARPALPAITVRTPAAAFQKPAEAKATLPTIAKPTISIRRAACKKTAVPQLPKTQPANVPVSAYTKPTITVSGIPAVAKPEITVSAFAAPKPAVTVPFVSVREWAPKTAKSVQTHSIALAAPPVQSTPVRAFVKPTHTPTDLPAQAQIRLPDAKKAMRRVLPASGKASDTSLGQNV